jgi:hypothetical protein
MHLASKAVLTMTLTELKSRELQGDKEGKMVCRTLALGCPSLECQSCHLSAEEEARHADLVRCRSAELGRVDGIDTIFTQTLVEESPRR